MDVEYDWRFLNPGEINKVDMYLGQNNQNFFSAHLHLKRKKVSSGIYLMLSFVFRL